MGIKIIIETIKQIHYEDIVLIKIGKFYQVYGKDSYIISYLFGYKLKKVEEMYTCGFPYNSLNKVITKLEDKKINYLIVDRKNNYDIESYMDNKNLNNYTKYFEKSKKYVNYKKRIDNINQFMVDNIDKSDFKDIIMKMEEIVNERRKIQSN